MELEIKLLNAFRAVADCGSFTAAGKRLGMTQSAISQHIQALEKALGVSLMIRSNKLAGLTPAGELFLQSVRRILDSLEQARSMVADYSRSGGGRLRIGAPASACQWLLPEIMIDVHGQLPGMELCVREGDTADNCARLMAGELDFALISGSPRHKSLALVEMGRDELVLVVPPDHPLAREDCVHAAQLRGQRMILPAYPTGDSVHWNDFMMEGGLFPKIAIETNSIAMAKQLVVSGIGLTIVPRWTVAAQTSCGQLHAASFGPAGLWRNWYAAYPQAHRLSAQGRVFLRVCAQRLPRLFAASAGATHISRSERSDASAAGDAASSKF